VEVIDGTLDYNILLGCTWVYTMAAVISTYFHIFSFPHKGDIVAIEKLTFFNSNSHVIESAALVGKTLHSYQHVGVRLLKDSLLVGNFSLPPPPLLDNSPLVSYINMISSYFFVDDHLIIPDEINIHNFCG